MPIANGSNNEIEVVVDEDQVRDLLHPLNPKSTGFLDWGFDHNSIEIFAAMIMKHYIDATEEGTAEVTDYGEFHTLRGPLQTPSKGPVDPEVWSRWNKESGANRIRFVSAYVKRSEVK